MERNNVRKTQPLLVIVSMAGCGRYIFFAGGTILTEHFSFFLNVICVHFVQS
jgi:hypothetical protein